MDEAGVADEFIEGDQRIDTRVGPTRRVRQRGRIAEARTAAATLSCFRSTGRPSTRLCTGGPSRCDGCGAPPRRPACR